ncbi:MAG: OmpA family protein [Deltaproteobacteria bacterium]|jgi:OOP family OmpA-OmpF porin|nr:OmpA family protein [Deltaproteobacteria bacterium]
MKSKLTILIALALCLSFSSLAVAQVREGSAHLSIMGGGIFPNELNIDRGAVFGVGLGYNFTKNWGLEGFLHYAPGLSDDIPNVPDSALGDNDIFFGRLNALYHFDTASAFVPYLTFGIGWMDDSRELYDDYGSFTGNAGLGFKYFFNDTVALRMEATEVMGFREQHNDRFIGPMVTAGLTFQVGGGEDTCIDSDGDGVCDPYDRCPGTPAGYRVDADGCPITVSITLDVKFDFDKSVVKPQYRAEVEKAASFLSAHPGSTVELQGHTDSKGSDEYNLKLSDRRANAVREYLVREFGINPARVTARGYGETMPIASNDTEEGRAINRRVVGVFSGTDVDR